jgi:pimeloyl-ACP methyl ester carboxylesterase
MTADFDTAHNTLAMSCENRGQGESCLMFLPGWCESRGVFAPVIDRLQSRYRILDLDLPGHGESPMPATDFGFDEITAAAIRMLDRQKVEVVIPVAHSHAGWIAIELHRRLGARIPKLVLLDWIVLDPPPEFIAALKALQDRRRWQQTRDQLFAMWLEGPAPAEVVRHVREDMGACKAEMWARAGREILRAYRLRGNPLEELAAFPSPVPTIHIYSQPRDEAYLAAQLEFASTHPWFQVQRIDASTHFPTLEDPESVTNRIGYFLG